jgi:hypothetical protein
MLKPKLPESFVVDFYSRTAGFIKTLIPPEVEDSIFEYFLSRRVAIAVSKEVLGEPNGQFMVAMTVNLLARFCPNLILFVPETAQCTAKIPLASPGAIAECLLKLVRSINPSGSVVLNPSKTSRYHSSIAIGGGGKNIRSKININCDGWLSFVDTNGNSLEWVSRNNNPIGAYVAACLGVAEIFKDLLYGLLKKETVSTLHVGNLIFSSLDYGFMKRPFVNPSVPESVDLGPVHFISMGGLNSAALYALCSLPRITGDLTFVEPQKWDVSNLNRCVLLTASSAMSGISKVVLAKEIASRYLATVNTVELDYRVYRREYHGRMALAIVGVDNNESRWDVQKDHPNLLICGGTERGQVTVSCHDSRDDKACAACIYPHQQEEQLQNQPVPTISFTSALAGFLMAGEVLKSRVAELLKYRLDLVLEMEARQASILQVFSPSRSADCKIDCSGREMIA